MSRKIFVTGGAGFIGSNFVRFLRRQRPDWAIVNFDALTYAGNLEDLADLETDYKRVLAILGMKPPCATERSKEVGPSTPTQR